MELSESSSGETAEQVRARARKPTPSAERAIWRGIPRRRPTSNPRTFSRRTRSRWPARIVEDAKHQSAELADIGIDVPPNKLAGRSPKQFRQLDAKGRFFYYGIDKEKKQLTNRVEQYVSLAGSEKAVPPAKSDLPFGLQTILEVGADAVLLSGGLPPGVTELVVDAVSKKTLGEKSTLEKGLSAVVKLTDPPHC